MPLNIHHCPTCCCQLPEFTQKAGSVRCRTSLCRSFEGQGTTVHYRKVGDVFIQAVNPVRLDQMIARAQKFS